MCADIESAADDLGFVETPDMLDISITPVEQVADGHASYRRWHGFGSIEVATTHPTAVLGHEEGLTRREMLLGQGLSGAALLVRWGLVAEALGAIDDLILNMEADTELPDYRPELRRLAEWLKN